MKNRRFAVYAWVVVGWNLAVIVWGALVRATGSGAGCGSHWPLCNGEMIPRAAQAQTLIELTHRLMSGLALILLVLLVVQAFRVYPKKHRVRRGALWSLVFILTEALIGAGLVLLELVGQNASMARAIYMSVHLINTFVLLMMLGLTAWWSSGGQALEWKGQCALFWLLALSLTGTLLLAVSGAIAALGDTLFPSNTLAAGLSQDFSPTAHLLVRLRLLHPVLAVAIGILLILTAFAASLMRPSLWTRRWSIILAALVLVQLAAGLLNLLLLAPVWLQLVHLLLADLLWLALVLLSASALGQRAAEKASIEGLSFRAAVEL